MLLCGRQNEFDNCGSRWTHTLITLRNTKTHRTKLEPAKKYSYLCSSRDWWYLFDHTYDGTRLSYFCNVMLIQYFIHTRTQIMRYLNIGVNKDHLSTANECLCILSTWTLDWSTNFVRNSYYFESSCGGVACIWYVQRFSSIKHLAATHVCMISAIKHVNTHTHI